VNDTRLSDHHERWCRSDDVFSVSKYLARQMWSLYLANTIHLVLTKSVSSSHAPDGLSSLLNQEEQNYSRRAVKKVNSFIRFLSIKNSLLLKREGFSFAGSFCLADFHSIIHFCFLL
jgi:hypothetical protein